MPNFSKARKLTVTVSFYFFDFFTLFTITTSFILSLNTVGYCFFILFHTFFHYNHVKHFFYCRLFSSFLTRCVNIIFLNIISVHSVFFLTKHLLH